MNDFNNSDELSTDTSEEVTQNLKSIAETGNVEVEWSDLQRALILRLDAMVGAYQEKDDEQNKNQVEEPNIKKFDRSITRDEIIELIESFSEPPFTIQRVCELLYSPFKYYDRVGTFLRGLEKNLRVISSNNWPKSLDNGIDNTTCDNIGSDINISNSNNINSIDDSNNHSNSNNNNNNHVENSNDVETIKTGIVVHDDDGSNHDEEADNVLEVEDNSTTTNDDNNEENKVVESNLINVEQAPQQLDEDNNEEGMASKSNPETTCNDEDDHVDNLATKSDELDEQSTTESAGKLTNDDNDSCQEAS